MQCKNCGAILNDGTLFCTKCGTKLEEVQYDLTDATELQPIVYDTPDVIVNENAGKKKKKKKALPVLIVILVLVLLLLIGGGVGALFWKNIFFAVSPERYTLKLFENTFDKIEEEVSSVQNNVFGFELTPENKATILAQIQHNSDDGDIAFNLEVANNPSAKELLAEAKVKRDDVDLEFQAYLNDTNIGALLPGYGKFLTVPSKDFGEKLLDSDGYISECIDDSLNKDQKKLLKGLDLSYTELFNSESSEAIREALDKYGDKAFINVIKNSDVGERESIKYSFKNKTVNAKEIPITVDTEDVIDAFIEILEAVQEDKAFNEKFSRDTLKQLDDFIDELNDSKKDASPEEFTVTIVEYKTRIVEMRFEFEEKRSGSRSNVAYRISSTDKDNLLDGITMAYDNKYKSKNYSSSSSTTLEFVSNWVCEDKDISLEVDIKNSYKSDNYSYKSTGNTWLNLDFGKGKWELGYKTDDGDGYKENEKFNGKCSKKDGFEFNYNNKYTYTDIIEQYGSSYEDWLEEWYEDKFDEYSYTYLRDIYYDDYADLYTTKYAGYYYRYSYKEYTYPSYSDWVDTYYYDSYNVNDYRFQEWLLDYLYMDEYDLRNLYEEEELEYIDVEKNAELDVNVNIKNSVSLKLKDKKNENILKWDESDFEDFIKDVGKEIQKYNVDYE